MKTHKQQNNWSFEPTESRDFIAAQAPALHLAFSTLAKKAVEDSIQDGPSAIENASMYAQAAIAVDPQDQLSRMLADELSKGWDGALGEIKIPDTDDLAADIQREDRITRDLGLIEAHFIAAREAGSYRLMEKYALHGERMAAQSLGLTNVRTLNFGANSADAMRLSGQPTAALDKLRIILPGLEKSPGRTSRMILFARFVEASCLESTGRSTEALEALTADEDGIIAGWENLLGSEHPETLTNRYLAASCLQSTGRAAEALELLKRDNDGLIALYEKVRGADHPETLTSRYLAASCLQDTGRAAEALELLTRDNDGIIDLEEKVKGAEHPDSLTSRTLAARCHIDLGQPEQAAKIHAGVLDALLAKGLTEESRKIKRARKVEALLAEAPE